MRRKNIHKKVFGEKQLKYNFYIDLLKTCLIYKVYYFII